MKARRRLPRPLWILTAAGADLIAVPLTILNRQRRESMSSRGHLRVTSKVGEILNSMSHGTGRRMSRAECKPFADSYDYSSLRRSILVPSGVEDSSLRTDGPFAYRDLDECLNSIAGYVEVEERFSVVGYVGHLG